MIGQLQRLYKKPLCFEDGDKSLTCDAAGICLTDVIGAWVPGDRFMVGVSKCRRDSAATGWLRYRNAVGKWTCFSHCDGCRPYCCCCCAYIAWVGVLGTHSRGNVSGATELLLACWIEPCWTWGLLQSESILVGKLHNRHSNFDGRHHKF